MPVAFELDFCNIPVRTACLPGIIFSTDGYEGKEYGTVKFFYLFWLRFRLKIWIVNGD